LVRFGRQKLEGYNLARHTDDAMSDLLLPPVDIVLREFRSVVKLVDSHFDYVTSDTQGEITSARLAAVVAPLRSFQVRHPQFEHTDWLRHRDLLSMFPPWTHAPTPPELELRVRFAEGIEGYPSIQLLVLREGLMPFLEDATQDTWLPQLVPTTGPHLRTRLATLTANLLLATNRPSEVDRLQALEVDVRKLYGTAGDWPAAEASRFAWSILKNFDPVRHKADLREYAEEFLKRAVKELDADGSHEAFMNILRLAHEPGPRNWCWTLLGELAELRSDALLMLELTYQLSHRELPEDLKKAQSLATEAERRILENPEGAPSWQQEFAQLARATALSRLTIMGLEDRSMAAERQLRDLLDSDAADAVDRLAHEQLLELLLAQRRFSEASQLVDKALDEWSNNSTFWLQKFWSELLSGNKRAAVEVLNRVDRMTPIDEQTDPETMFVVAFGQLLTSSGTWSETGRRFLETDHPNVPYIALMLYARLAGEERRDEARDLLDQRWQRIDPETWAQRLRGGDLSAWREMLIRYYLNKFPRDHLLRPLMDDAEFSKTDLQFLPITRRGMLCEALFYDALLAETTGDRDRRVESLRLVLATNRRDYFEYKMAQFLLDELR
jgi:hypothetical protein